MLCDFTNQWARQTSLRNGMTEGKPHAGDDEQRTGYVAQAEVFAAREGADGDSDHWNHECREPHRTGRDALQEPVIQIEGERAAEEREVAQREQRGSENAVPALTRSKSKPGTLRATPAKSIAGGKVASGSAYAKRFR